MVRISTRIVEEDLDPTARVKDRGQTLAPTCPEVKEVSKAIQGIKVKVACQVRAKTHRIGTSEDS